MTDKTLKLLEPYTPKRFKDDAMISSAKNDSGLLTCGVNSQIPLKATLEEKRESLASIHIIEVDPSQFN